MTRIVLLTCTALAACSPTPAENDMRSTSSATPPAAAPASPASPAAESPPVAAAPGGLETGRRIVSTAFVRLGAGEALGLDLADGRSLTLRDARMNAADVCGVSVADGNKGCAPYAQVVAARVVAGGTGAQPPEMSPTPPAPAR